MTFIQMSAEQKDRVAIYIDLTFASSLGTDCIYSLHPEPAAVDEMQSIESRLMRLETYLPSSGRARLKSSSSSNSIKPMQIPSPPTSLSSDDPISGVQQYLMTLLNSICHSEEAKLTEENISLTYFEHINTWLPIISRKQFSKKLGGHGSRLRRPEIDLQLTCMYLLVKEPSRFNFRCETDKIYKGARYAYFMLQAESLGSVELAQCGLMLATYEHATGLVEQAYATIWTCVRMMHSLRFRDKLQMMSNCDENELVECAEAYSLWWAILIRDR